MQMILLILVGARLGCIKMLGLTSWLCTQDQECSWLHEFALA